MKETITNEQKPGPYKGVGLEFLESRLKFLDINGKASNSLAFPSMIVIFTRIIF
jgi:hypothetical protein